MQWVDRVGRRLKLRDLHILLTVVQRGSMAKAAAALAISQPAVSKAIADMEHTVGLRLLDRRRNGLEPTAYGSALLGAVSRSSTNSSTAWRSSRFSPTRPRESCASAAPRASRPGCCRPSSSASLASIPAFILT